MIAERCRRQQRLSVQMATVFPAVVCHNPHFRFLEKEGGTTMRKLGATVVVSRPSCGNAKRQLAGFV